MTEQTERDKAVAAAPSGNVMLGIAMKVTSVVGFMAMYAFLKAAHGVPAGQMTFFRSFFGIFPVLVWLVMVGELRYALVTKNLVGHIFRSGFGTLSMFFYFYALTLLPLPETIAIYYGEPLVLVILCAIFLKEVVRFYRWSAVILGLIGVTIILWPRLSLLSSGQADIASSIGALSALTSAILAAIAMLLVRKLVFTERTTTIVLYFMIISSVISLLTIPFGWIMPDFKQFCFLVCSGLAGGVAQIFMTTAYRHAEPSVVAPFEYTSMILGLAIGYFIFHEEQTTTMLMGAALVIGAGLFIILREAHLIGPGTGRRRAASHKNR